MAKLITKADFNKLVKNGQNPNKNHKPVVKLFTPDANATWLISEIDPKDHDQAFAICDVGLGEVELGWISLTEIMAIRGKLRLPVERDMWFSTDKTVSELLPEFKAHRRITL